MNEAAVVVRPGEQAAATGVGLEVRSIAKAYDRRAVLHDVSLSVHRGEVVGLLGPNGAGKTTCFYSVMGLVMPDSGRAVVDGGPPGVNQSGGRVTGHFTVPQNQKSR